MKRGGTIESCTPSIISDQRGISVSHSADERDQRRATVCAQWQPTESDALIIAFISN
jgi:hypothetical protein